MSRPARLLPALGSVLSLLLLTGPVRADDPLLLVTNSPYEIFQGGRTFVHVVVFDPAFRPVPGARVLAAGQEVGRTDRHGSLVFSHRPRGAFVLRAEAELDGKPHAGAVPMEAYPRTESFESRQLFVHTDRGLYRPGDPILLRALCWRLRGDFRPVAGAELEASLLSPEGRVVTGTRLVTDAFGAAAGELWVPGDCPEGLFQLVVRHQDAEERARLRIKRFNPPAIDIQHNLPRFIAPASPALAVEVRLGYFTGGAPRAGRLKARASHQGRVLWSAEVALSPEGPVRFGLPLDGIRQAVADGQRFEVLLEVEDEHGRRDELVRDILYASKPYLAVPDLDKDGYLPGEEVVLSVRLQDPDGVPVRDKLLRLQAGEQRLEARTDQGGVALFRLRMPAQTLELEVQADDVPGPLCRTRAELLERKPLRASVEQPVVRERRPIPLRVTFAPDFVPVERVVHVDVTDSSGALVGGFALPIHRTPAGPVAAGTIPAPTWGSMLLTLYTAGMPKEDARRARSARTVGLLTEGLSLVAHPDKELAIRLDGVPDQARPRETLRARLLVTGPGGKPAEALLGIMLVDRAVLSLMDPLEKTPMDRFYNPTLKVLSTTGSDILTWPVVSRNWGDEQQDIALPPFGFQEGGAPARHARMMLSMPGKMSGGAVGSSEPIADVTAKMAKPQVAAEAAPGDAAPPAPPARPDAHGRRRPTSAEPALPAIVIRTDLPATALWEPRLAAPAGRASLEVRLPDALTEQQLVALASDKRGGVGLLRKNVRVSQPLFVRLDAPRVLAAGDALEVGVLVHHAGPEPVRAEVVLRAEGGSLPISPGSIALEVPAGGAAAARFRLGPAAPGLAVLRAEARAGALVDREARELEVRPAGEPVEEVQAFTLRGKSPIRATLPAEPGRFREAHLELSFPSLTPVLEELEALLDRSAWWADGHLASPLAAVAVERWLARHRPKDPLRRTLREHLTGVAAGLETWLNPDGGAAWWRSGPASSPHATARALRLMAALREADVAVPDALFLRAVRFLRARQAEDGLWPIEDIAFWEGRSEQVREQVAAGLFRALAEAARAQRLPAEEQAWIAALGERFALRLDEGLDDPLTLAEAALGLARLKAGLRGEPAKASRARLAGAAERLLALRKTGRWEPSWFHAYGGSIEATAASLELLARLAPDGQAHDDALRAGLLYLLSTRPGWGGWHNPSGTAEAIRALCLLPLPLQERRASVRVRFRGQELARVQVDPRDPYASTLALRHLSLAPGEEAGALEVDYDGLLEVPARLVVRRFGGLAGEPRAGLRLTRRLGADQVEAGRPVEVHLALEASRPGLVRVSAPTPPHARLEPRSLEALRTSPGVKEVRELPGRLELVFEGQQAEWRYRLEGTRPGRAELAPAEARWLALESPPARTPPDALVVREADAEAQ
jgi:hypothetical protein